MRLLIISAVSIFATCTGASPTPPPPVRAYDASSQQVFIGPSRDSTPQFPSKPGHRPAGFIALGDSYSAGIGTGVDGPEDECRHGLHAYPALIQADMTDHEGANTTSFQFLSCTGSTTDDLLSGGATSQVDNLNTTIDADFALLSVGGNDLGFFDIMNSCIFRFYSVYSGTCEAALRRSDEQLASPDFEHRLKLAIMEILDRVKWERKPWFTIFMTGYARFFSVETDECDESSFGVWWRGPKLKRELRQRMNKMVLDVNAKIQSSVDAINAGFSERKIFLVNYDAAFEGHRFCEPHVTEPDYARNETYFFLVGGPDNAGYNQSNSETLTTPVLAASSSSLVDPDACLPAAQRSGDWGELAVCMMARAAREDPGLQDRTGDFVAENSMWYVPTYYGKTFHPRSLGHKAIRDQIYKVWEELHATHLQT